MCTAMWPLRHAALTYRPNLCACICIQKVVRRKQQLGFTSWSEVVVETGQDVLLLWWSRRFLQMMCSKSLDTTDVSEIGLGYSFQWGACPFCTHTMCLRSTMDLVISSERWKMRLKPGARLSVHSKDSIGCSWCLVYVDVAKQFGYTTLDNCNIRDGGSHSHSTETAGIASVYRCLAVWRFQNFLEYLSS